MSFQLCFRVCFSHCSWGPTPTRSRSAASRLARAAGAFPLSLFPCPFLHFCYRPVGFRPPVPVELPRVADLLDHSEIQIGDDEFIFIAARHGDELSSRVAEITLTVELADVPGFLH